MIDHIICIANYMHNVTNTKFNMPCPIPPPMDRVKPMYYAHGSNFQRNQFLLLYLVKFCNKYAHSSPKFLCIFYIIFLHLFLISYFNWLLFWAPQYLNSSSALVATNLFNLWLGPECLWRRLRERLSGFDPQKIIYKRKRLNIDDS